MERSTTKGNQRCHGHILPLDKCRHHSILITFNMLFEECIVVNHKIVMMIMNNNQCGINNSLVLYATQTLCFVDLFHTSKPKVFTIITCSHTPNQFKRLLREKYKCMMTQIGVNLEYSLMIKKMKGSIKNLNS